MKRIRSDHCFLHLISSVMCDDKVIALHVQLSLSKDDARHLSAKGRRGRFKDLQRNLHLHR